MTNPPHPEQPSHPTGPVHGPYAPGPSAGRGGDATAQGRPPYAPPPQRPPADDLGSTPGPPAQSGRFTRTDLDAPAQKGIVGALLDVNFNHLVTPKLIKVIYLLALVLVSLSALVVLAFGFWVFQLRNGWLLGGLIIIASPVAWILQALLVRIAMESVIVRYKSTDYLRAIKDKI